MALVVVDGAGSEPAEGGAGGLLDDLPYADRRAIEAEGARARAEAEVERECRRGPGRPAAEPVPPASACARLLPLARATHRRLEEGLPASDGPAVDAARYRGAPAGAEPAEALRAERLGALLEAERASTLELTGRHGPAAWRACAEAADATRERAERAVAATAQEALRINHERRAAHRAAASRLAALEGRRARLVRSVAALEAACAEAEAGRRAAKRRRT